MSIVHFILGDWRISLFAGLVVAALAWNAMNRISWDIAWNGLGNRSTPIPEKCWTYDAHDLELFAHAAKDARMLEHYRNSILLGSDICFAVALSSITAFIWYQIAVTPMDCAALNWAALPLGAMAILYGIADVAEDIKLAAILKHPLAIDRAEAAATNMLTRIKMVTLVWSVIGVLIFIVLAVLETLVVRLRSRKRVPA